MSRDVNTDVHDEDSHDVFQELRQTGLKYKNNTIIKYLNVNSIQYKFMEVGELLYAFSRTRNWMTRSISKVSTPLITKHLETTVMPRGGGGLMAYVRSNLPARRRSDLELQWPIESIVLDVKINDRKWAVIGAYRPQSVDNKLFSDIVTKGIHKISTHYKNIIVAGCLHYDCLDNAKSKTLTDICDIFDFTNLLVSATCFMKHCTLSLVDVFLTNKPNFCFNALNLGVASVTGTT